MTRSHTFPEIVKNILNLSKEKLELSVCHFAKIRAFANLPLSKTCNSTKFCIEREKAIIANSTAYVNSFHGQRND